MNRQQLYEQARREVERRRQRAETDALARREELYAKAPGLAQWDQRQTEAGAQAAVLAADGQHEKARSKLAEVRQASEKRAALLRQMGYTAARLEPDYHCAECHDSGRVNGKVCRCVVEEIRRLRRAEVNQSGPLSLCRFENFSLEYYPERGEDGSAPRRTMQGILADCQDYAADFGPHSGSLFLYGDAGLGKTHLALSIASAVLDKGFDVIYVSAQNAFSKVSAERFDRAGDMFGSMLEADLLILDDLGTEFIDAYVLSKLYELVNGRLRRPTIYTTNICRQELLNQRYTEKIASRLMGECHLMRFFGNDIRLIK